MKHPIAHYQHTERPVGTFTKCGIEGKKLEVFCDIYDTSDTDDVWEEIEKGDLNKFSIYGRRLKASAECSLKPHQRFSPCITKALDLFSISLVGDNAINERTFLEVVKGEPMPEEEEKKEEEVEKGDDDGSLIHDSKNVSEIMKRLGNVEEAIKCFQETKKSEEEMEEKKDEKKDEEVQKAAPVEEKPAVAPVVEAPPVIEPVVKAVMEDTITKAFVEDEIKKAKEEFSKAVTELKAELEEMKKVKIEKGGKIVILQEEFRASNPQVSNLEAIR